MAKKYCFTDIIVSAVILLIGASEAAHLYGVFLGGTLERCCILFIVLAALSLGLPAGAAVWIWRRGRTQLGENPPGTGKELILLAVFLILLVTQLLYMFSGRSVYRLGDITLETVASFLENGSIYQINPMTGNAYAAGMPNRIKILCLPSLYAMLSSLFSVEPGTMVWRVIPLAVLIGCYAAYFCLGSSLFPGDRCRQLCFLIITAILIWVGSYRYGMDGFGILYSGWRGVVWRNAVLIPYAVSLCLRKKYCHALLCALAEACIVWTLYGLGVCLPVIAGMALIDFFRKKLAARREDK